MTKRLEALKAAKNTSAFWGNSEPMCPHCGTVHDIDRNEWWHLYDDNDSHEVDCPSCELPFTVRTHASYTFSTDEQDD